MTTKPPNESFKNLLPKLSQSTDTYNKNQSYLINLDKCFKESDEIDTTTEVNIDQIPVCTYCKAMSYPKSLITGSNNNSNEVEDDFTSSSTTRSIIKTHKLQQLHIDKDEKYICRLCSAINEKPLNTTTATKEVSLPPFFKEEHNSKKNHLNNNLFSNNIQSLHYHKTAKTTEPEQSNKNNEIITNETISPSTTTSSSTTTNYEINFVFLIDLLIVDITIIEHLRTVLIEFFKEKIITSCEQEQSQPSSSQQSENLYNNKETYYITIMFYIHGKLFLADVKNLESLNINCFLDEESERKNLLSLFISCRLKMHLLENITCLEEYLSMLIEEKHERSFLPNSKLPSFEISKHYSRIIETFWLDRNILHNYVPVLITKCPVIRYEQHFIKKHTIYSVVFLFYEEEEVVGSNESTITNKITNKSTNTNINNLFKQSGGKTHYIFEEEFKLIKDNQEAYLLADDEEDNVEFYYKLYELLEIVNFPKIFKPRFQIKTNHKYPPKFYNQLPHFFIKPNQIIAIEDKFHEHKRFQFIIRFENYKQEREMLVINWRRESSSLKIQQSERDKLLAESQSELSPLHIPTPSQSISPVPISWHQLPSIFSSFSTIIEIIVNSLLSSISANNRPSSSNPSHSLTPQQKESICCYRILNMLNNFMNSHRNHITSNSIVNVDPELIYSLYLFVEEMGVKNPYSVLSLIACANRLEYVFKIYPIVFLKGERNMIVYWGEGWERVLSSSLLGENYQNLISNNNNNNNQHKHQQQFINNNNYEEQQKQEEERNNPENNNIICINENCDSSETESSESSESVENIVYELNNTFGKFYSKEYSKSKVIVENQESNNRIFKESEQKSLSSNNYFKLWNGYFEING